MNPTTYTLLFLGSFALSLAWAYSVGNKHGKKEMLDVMKNKNIISADTYVKLLNILNK